MQVYSYSEARQKFATLLKLAETTGKVVIRRRDGCTFALVPETVAAPLDVPTIEAKISTREIVALVRQGRERQRVK